MRRTSPSDLSARPTFNALEPRLLLDGQYFTPPTTFEPLEKRKLLAGATLLTLSEEPASSAVPSPCVPPAAESLTLAPDGLATMPLTNSPNPDELASMSDSLWNRAEVGVAGLTLG